MLAKSQYAGWPAYSGRRHNPEDSRSLELPVAGVCTGKVGTRAQMLMYLIINDYPRGVKADERFTSVSAEREFISPESYLDP